MKLDYKSWSDFLKVARGDQKAEKCFRNVKIVNPLLGEVKETDFAVHKGIIVGCGDYDALENIDCQGYYACAGFIEGHIHIESSLLTPQRFAEAVIPWGTTTVVADPHEIANVCGLDGIRYFLESAELIDFVDFYFMLPSCVPASPFETSGASLEGVDLLSYLNHPRVIGLGELMNFPGLIGGDKKLWEKVFLFHDALIDGHAPLLSGKALNAYAFSGIRSDHESTRPEEALNKIAVGIFVMIREGSQTKDLENLVGIINNVTWSRCMFVSDDKHPDELLSKGHMNVHVNRAVELGLSPIMALALATWTPSLYFNFKDRGALLPGTLADFSLSPSLHPWVPERVFKRGEEVARDGKALVKANKEVVKPKNPMNIGKVVPSDFAVKAKGENIRVIGIRRNSIITDSLIEKAPVKQGFVVSDPQRDIVKVAVWNRYEVGSKPSIGFCKGLGLKKGAIASTVAHDHHNIVVAGIDDESMALAVEALKKHGGGLVAVSSKEDLLVLPLEVAGLMTDRPIEKTARRLVELKNKLKSMGTSIENPFMALSFIALAVIPSLKITDKGLVDVDSFSFVYLFVD